MYSANGNLTYTKGSGWLGDLKIDGQIVTVSFDYVCTLGPEHEWELLGLDWELGCGCPECQLDEDTIAEAIWRELGL